MTNLEEEDALGGMDITAMDQKSKNYATRNGKQKAMEL